MADGDEILSGFVIAGMVVIGISCIGYFIRKRCNKSKMKESTSETNLATLGDPEQI